MIALMTNLQMLAQRLSKIKKFYANNGYIPSYSDMCEIFGFSSKNSVTRFVDELVSGGHITKEGGSLSPTRLFFSIPHLGFIKAGSPSEVITDIYDTDNTLYIGTESIFAKESVYALTVSGDSMTGAGILEGDIAILDRSKRPVSGDIIAA